jgi:hypothetical protein
VRRGLGRGRSLIALGSILAICSMPLAWLKVGGVVLAAETASGFDGTGVVMFLAAVVMLALIVLPYTTRSGQLALDRPAVYVALLLLALAGLVSAVLGLLGTEGSSLAPQDAPGLWLAIGGMALATWGVLELLAERTAGP